MFHCFTFRIQFMPSLKSFRISWFHGLCNLSFAHRNYKCDWNGCAKEMKENLMHFASISGSWRIKVHTGQKKPLRAGDPVLWALFFFGIPFEKVSCRIVDTVWFRTEVWCDGRLCVNKQIATLSVCHCSLNIVIWLENSKYPYTKYTKCLEAAISWQKLGT